MKLLAVLLLMNVGVSFGQTLIPYYKDGLYGYCNLKKEVVIPPQYNGCGFFSEGLAWVKKGDFYGYIHDDGKMVVKPQYTKASNFQYGTAIVALDETYYVINSRGKQLNKKGAEHALRVADSLIACDNGKWTFLDQNGKAVYTYDFDEVGFYPDNKDYITLFDLTTQQSTFFNLRTGVKQNKKPFAQWRFSNPDSLKVLPESNGLADASTPRVVDKDDNVVISQQNGTFYTGNHMEFIVTVDNNTGKSQIYISSKKKFSRAIPGTIAGVDFEQDDEPYAFQNIEGKYYFLCQLSAKELPDVQPYICIDEDGHIFADF